MNNREWTTKNGDLTWNYIHRQTFLRPQEMSKAFPSASVTGAGFYLERWRALGHDCVWEIGQQYFGAMLDLTLWFCWKMLMFFCFWRCFDLFNEICCRKPPGGMFYGISPTTQEGRSSTLWSISWKDISLFDMVNRVQVLHANSLTSCWMFDFGSSGGTKSNKKLIDWGAPYRPFSWWPRGWQRCLARLFLLKTSRPTWSTWSKGRHLRLWLRTALPPTAGTLRCETWPAIWNMGRAPRAAWSTCWWFCAWTHLRWPTKRLLLGLLTQGRLLTPQSPCRPQLTLCAVPFDQLSCNHRG